MTVRLCSYLISITTLVLMPEAQSVEKFVLNLPFFIDALRNIQLTLEFSYTI